MPDRLGGNFQKSTRVTSSKSWALVVLLDLNFKREKVAKQCASAAQCSNPCKRGCTILERGHMYGAATSVKTSSVTGVALNYQSPSACT